MPTTDEPDESNNEGPAGDPSGPGPSPRANDISAEVFLRFIEPWLSTDPVGRTTLNGTPLTDQQVRALRRWRAGGHNPSLFVVDSFLTHGGIHLQHLFRWAQVMYPEGAVWARRVEPLWHQAPPTMDEE